MKNGSKKKGNHGERREREEVSTTYLKLRDLGDVRGLKTLTNGENKIGGESDAKLYHFLKKRESGF